MNVFNRCLSATQGFVPSYYDKHQGEEERCLRNQKIEKFRQAKILRLFYECMCVCVCVCVYVC